MRQGLFPGRDDGLANTTSTVSDPASREWPIPSRSAPEPAPSLPVKLPGRPGDRMGYVLRLAAVDLVAVLLSIMLGRALLLLFQPTAASPHPGLGYALAAPSFLAAFALNGNYRHRWHRLRPSVTGEARSMAQSFATGVLLLVGSDALLAASGRDMHLTQACALLLPAVLTVPSLRLVASRTVTRAHQPRSRLLIIGSGRVAMSVARRLRRHQNLELVGFVDDGSPETDVIGPLAALPVLIEQHRVDRVLVAFSRTPTYETLLMLRGLNGRVDVSVVPRMYELLSWRSTIEELHGIPLLHVAPKQISRVAVAGKRVLDVVLSFGALLILAPALAAIALAIRLNSPGPVIFRQQRTGRHRQPFGILKFRTMVVDADELKVELAALNEADGPLFKIRRDPRVTRVGAWLRRTSLDELPQLVNVLRGEMSLVGPRPFPPAEAAQIQGWARSRFSVPPGITGLWQVSGRSELTNEDLLHLDWVYVSSWSLWWDIRILLRTPACVLGQSGAF